MKAVAFILLLGVAGVASAQTVRQIHEQVFCNDSGLSVYQALADYRNGVPMATALQRADGYVCTESRPMCDTEISILRKNIAGAYELGDNADVHTMTGERFLQFADEFRTRTVATCMQVVLHR